jgi:hypothetical protein
VASLGLAAFAGTLAAVPVVVVFLTAAYDEQADKSAKQQGMSIEHR